MGFHMVQRVYDDVKGTSGTAQAILAYLAHKADDKGVLECRPTRKTIEAATHFTHDPISKALNDLREAGILDWKSGGRHKGGGGRALANVYYIKLPPKQPKGSDRQKANADAVKQSKLEPPTSQCVDRQEVTIIPSQPLCQPSVNGDTEAETGDLKREFERMAAEWKPNVSTIKRQVDQEHSLREKEKRALVDAALEVCGLRRDDNRNRDIFSSTISCRDPQDVRDVLYRVSSEMRQGELKQIESLPKYLNSELAKLSTNRRSSPPKSSQ